MKRHRETRPVADWKSINHAYECSGQNQRDFCRTHRLAPSTFQKWRRHFKSCELSETGLLPAGFKPIVVVPPARESLAVSSKPACWDIELELPDGMVLRIRKGTA